VVKLDFDEKIITYEKILKIFFQIHDPTTLNSQGPDFGTQYRSEIFYLNDNQKMIAEKVLNEVNERLSGKVVTRISLLKNYCPAEEYHQNFAERNELKYKFYRFSCGRDQKLDKLWGDNARSTNLWTE